MKKIFIIIAVIIAISCVASFYPTENNIFVERAEQRNTCNFDFRHATNIPKNQRLDYTNSEWKPKSCINTATSIYNENNTCTYCPHFVENPKKWGFKKVESPKPGDIIIFINEERAYHAGIIVKNSVIGPLMNHAAGGKIYKKHSPVKLYLMGASAIKVEYYRFIG